MGVGGGKEMRQKGTAGERVFECDCVGQKRGVVQHKHKRTLRLLVSIGASGFEGWCIQSSTSSARKSLSSMASDRASIAALRTAALKRRKGGGGGGGGGVARYKAAGVRINNLFHTKAKLGAPTRNAHFLSLHHT